MAKKEKRIQGYEINQFRFLVICLYGHYTFLPGMQKRGFILDLNLCMSTHTTRATRNRASLESIQTKIKQEWKKKPQQKHAWFWYD